MTKIIAVTVYNGEGQGDCFYIGKCINGMVIRRIRRVSEYINGDPFEHFVGYDEENDKVFAVNAYCHCLVEYNKIKDEK